MVSASAAESASGLVVQAMARSAIFCVLSAEARAKLAAHGRAQTFETGTMIWRAGDSGDCVYILLEGEIEVRMSSPDGRDLRIASLIAGDLVGEMAALDGNARSADIAAIRRTRVLRIPRQSLVSALESEPKAAMALVAELCRRLRKANVALETSALLDLSGRLARLLLEERNARGVTAMTQTEMARRIGASREAVNRKLRDFTRRGWIEILPIGILVIAPTSLEQLIEDAARL